MAEGFDDIDERSPVGPSPLVARLNATNATEVAVDLRCSFHAVEQPSAPIGMATGQRVEAYVHVFYNFGPRADWQFGRDGEHPVPP